MTPIYRERNQKFYDDLTQYSLSKPKSDPFDKLIPNLDKLADKIEPM